MKDHIKDYKEHLEQKIGQYMEETPSERNVEAVKGMMECWAAVDSAEQRMARKGTLTQTDAEHWADKLVNDDGTTGAHWTVDQTSAVAENIGVKFEHISKYDWWIAMNMLYSDYCKAAMNFGVNLPQFYAELAKAFLFDKDAPAPKEKLAAYYHYIVCPKGADNY